MPEFQPVRFGKYILLEKLATGGMAQLYKAKVIGVEGFEKLIAIKMILPHMAKEKELVSAFIDEAKLAALLNHQNVVQIYDFGNIEEQYFISMEFLFGKDLRSIWNRAKEKNLPLNLEYALFVISRVCSGLAYAHELKDFQGNPLHIIHRDISPQNIFVTYHGDVKIVDFGIAKAASQSTVTQFGMIKGKVSYMSPEQAAGKSIDQRSDIFSTGILLYELITNSKMFDGDSTIQILTKVRDAEYLPPQSIVAGLHPKVYGILGRALAKDPDNRYQSCNEMLADLEECIAELALRPTARGLAHYMKSLFDGKAAADDQPAKVASGSHELEEVKAESKPQAPPEESKAISESEQLQQKEFQEKAPEIPQEKPKKKIWPQYAAVAIVITLVIVSIAFWQKGKPVTPQLKSTVAAPSKPSTVVTSNKKAPIGVSRGTTASAVKEDKKDQEARIKAKMLLNQALQIANKQPQKARSLLLESVKLDPENIRGYFELGLVYVKLKDYPRAIESYTRAAELNPQFPDVYFNLGFAYAMNKNYAKAEEIYSRVVKMRPRYVDEALFNLAIVQEKQGKREECISTLEQAKAINPRNEVVRKYLDRMKGSVKKNT